MANGDAEPLVDTLRAAVTSARAMVRRRVGAAEDHGTGGPGARAGYGSAGGMGAGDGGVAGLGDDDDGGVTQPPRRPAGARGFVPALEGIRGLAAIGVVTTHVAFVTRATTGSPVKRLFGRLDLAVAVFFAKSGFLLWRAHASHAREDKPGTARPAWDYLRARLVRIMPAYLVLVATAMLLLEQNRVNGLASWIANLTLTQIYTTNFLVAGLTHAWSLAVEMAFYLVFPVLWTAMKKLRGEAARWRIPVILAFGASGLVFPMLPWHLFGFLPADVNVQILPPSFTA